VAWGAQTLSEHDAGAFTGEVSGAMLREFGCRYVIVGHSERRALYGETDQQVAAKFMAAQRCGLVPILCVGESLAQRERGDTQTVVARQFEAVLSGSGHAGSRARRSPMSRYGRSGRQDATPAQAQEVHAFLRALAAKRDREIAQTLSILYGGSVKAGNAKELFTMADVDGGLIGGRRWWQMISWRSCEAAAG